MNPRVFRILATIQTNVKATNVLLVISTHTRTHAHTTRTDEPPFPMAPIPQPRISTTTSSQYGVVPYLPTRNQRACSTWAILTLLHCVSISTHHALRSSQTTTRYGWLLRVDYETYYIHTPQACLCWSDSHLNILTAKKIKPEEEEEELKKQKRWESHFFSFSARTKYRVQEQQHLDTWFVRKPPATTNQWRLPLPPPWSTTTPK